MAASLKRDTILGVVFFLGILLLLWATAQLGSFSLVEKQTIEVHVPNARGLKVGDNVEFLGTKIGVVSKVDTDGTNEERPVRLFLRINRELKLRESYEVRVADASLLGGKIVAILPGRSGNAVDPATAPLAGIAPPNPLEALGDLLGGEDNRQNLANILRDVAGVVADLRDGKGSIGEMLTSARDFFKRADELAKELNDTVAEARKGEGEIGKVIVNASAFFDSGTKAIDEIRTGKGLLPRLINDEKLADEVTEIVSSVRVTAKNLEEGRGAIGKLLNDPETEKQVASILTEIETAVKAFNNGDGLINALLNDGEITKDVRRVVDNIDTLVADVRAGKGTIGRLFTDDTIANQIERLLNQISRTVEDAREAAPVSTFVQIFTGVFQ